MGIKISPFCTNYWQSKHLQNVQPSVTLWQSKHVKMYNLVSPCGNQNIVYMYVQTSVNLWQSKHPQNVQPGVTLWQSTHPQNVQPIITLWQSKQRRNVQHCGNENIVHMFIQMVAVSINTLQKRTRNYG